MSDCIVRVILTNAPIHTVKVTNAPTVAVKVTEETTKTVRIFEGPPGPAGPPGSGVQVPQFSYERIIAGFSLTVPEYQQMVVHQNIQVDGTLVLNGTLAVI